jgi:transcriptional regulator with XRE-family HTH domain
MRYDESSPNVSEKALEKMNESHPVDRHVGQRVRIARLARGMSQSALAEAVGLTFQQIQKYEKGTNRISASRLFQFAQILGVDIPYFFQGASPESALNPAAAPAPADFDLNRVNVAILQALSEIGDTKLKRKILDLISCVAGLDHVEAELSNVN